MEIFNCLELSVEYKCSQGVLIIDSLHSLLRRVVVVVVTAAVGFKYCLLTVVRKAHQYQ